jgi:hypothetical protein
MPDSIIPVDRRTLAERRSERTMRFRDLIAEARANHRALLRCIGPHTFEHIEATQGLCMNWRCSKCTGVISAVEYAWYLLGLDHGRTTGKMAEGCDGTTHQG